LPHCSNSIDNSIITSYPPGLFEDLSWSPVFKVGVSYETKVKRQPQSSNRAFVLQKSDCYCFTNQSLHILHAGLTPISCSNNQII